MTATAILNLGYVALVAASFTRAMIRLRTLLIAAAFLLAAFAAIENITSMMLWNAAIGTSHTVTLARELWLRKRQRLVDNEASLAEQTFPTLDDADLFAVWSAGTERLHRDAQLTTAGTQTDEVALVITGSVEIRRDSRVLARLTSGSLIGEMSFARDGVASADAFACGAVWLRVWTTESLARLAKTNPAASVAFTQLIQRDLANKLERSDTRSSTGRS